MNGLRATSPAADRLDDPRMRASKGDGPVAVIADPEDRGGPGNGLPSLTPFDAAFQLTRSNLSWTSAPGQPATVNYAFRLSATTLPDGAFGFSRFSAEQIAATELALAAWSDVANITFSRVNDLGSQYSNSATILFANYASGFDGAAAFAYLPGSANAAASAGDVWVNSSLSYNASPQMFGYGQLTLVHEIGHAIGLSHPASYNAGGGQTFSYGNNAGYMEDSNQYTVMSYFSERETGADFRIDRNGPAFYASAPMMDDIIAAQRLYGANLDTRTGDTVYGFNSNADRPWFSATAGSPLVFCVWDAGGIDTFDFSGFAQGGVIDLRQGAFSSVGGMIGNVSIVVGVVIENAIGSAHDDTMRGNSGDNRFESRGGSDSVDGGLGLDTLVLVGARSDYSLFWNGSTGYLQGFGKLITFANIEFLQFSDQTIAPASGAGVRVSGDLTDDIASGTVFGDTIYGAGGDDVIDGGRGDDALSGDAGDDVLTGGDGDDSLSGGMGLDRLDGGAGVDTVLFDTTEHRVVVDLEAGTATQAGLTEVIEGFENVTATDGNDVLIGDGAANRLIGGNGADRLEGRGGNDWLAAGAGGKSGGAPDIIKTSTQTNDSISTAVALTAFDLGPRHDVANATTVPHASVRATAHGGLEYYAVSAAAGETLTFDIDAAAFDSTLRIFDAAGNELARNDDAASDAGRAGTDSGLSHTFAVAGVYYIQVGEWAASVGAGFTSGGIGPGQTYVLHVSSPRATPVPIVSTGSFLDGGDGADTLRGGSGADTLIGGSGDDVIDGFGGGLDIIDGGDGDDLISWTGGATVDGGAGSDTVVYSGDRSQYTITVEDGVTHVAGPMGLDRLTGVERLRFADAVTDSTGAILVNEVTGTVSADTLEGTSYADSIRGFEGDDVINGGAGDDFIDGGAGLDTAVFHTGYFASNIIVDTVDGVTVVGSIMGTDRLVNVERLQFYNATLIVGAGGGQYYGRGDGDDWVEATEHDDQIESRDGADTLFGHGGDDVIQAGDGDDLITGGAGNDRIDGGAGHDIVEVSGAFSEYRLLQDGDDFILKGPDGRDNLTGIEVVRFADGRVLELNRLYGADGDQQDRDGGRIPETLLSDVFPDSGPPLVLPPARNPEPPADKRRDGAEILPGIGAGKDGDAPLVLPGVNQGAGFAARNADQPQVLPGPGDLDAFTLEPAAHARVWPGWTLAIEDEGWVADRPLDPGRSTDDWGL